MAGSIVLKCTCNHEFQDAEYGKSMRLHSISDDGKKAYCTVCSPSNRRNKEQLRPPRKAKSI